MFRKLFGRKREEPPDEDRSWRVTSLAYPVAPSRAEPDLPASDAEILDDLDQAARKYTHWELVKYGIDPDDTRLDRMPTDELNDWSAHEHESFSRQEQTWWESHLSSADTMIIAKAIDRYSLGGVRSYPFVSRPLDYGTFSQYREVSLQTARVLLDRGLATQRDAATRHLLLLSGIKCESAFSLALDHTAEQRLLIFSRDLRANRSAAEQIMLAEWGELPPNRGEEYDAMPFIIAERRIAFIYRQRNDDDTALDRAAKECQRMIEQSSEFLKLFASLESPLPEHCGFRQLAIIREKEKDYTAAISLATQALEEGWAGDWDKRIARCQRRASKP